MKRLCLVSVLFILTGFLAFGDAEEQEVDYLLFLPNSSNEFENQEQAMIHLNDIANYLKGRDIVPGQIHVYGYSANFANDIDSVNLSRERALFVIRELQGRELAADLFADPVGYGDVDTWGSNADEEDRGPNRRVRVVLDGNVVTTQTMQAAEPEEIAILDVEETVVQEDAEEQKSMFPWRILLLILLPLLFIALLLAKKKKHPPVTPSQETAKPEIVAASVFVPVVTSEKIVNLEEEIRFRSYELYLQHKDQYIDVDGDWYRAVCDVSARYDASGYQVYREDGSWWARKTFAQ